MSSQKRNFDLTRDMWAARASSANKVPSPSPLKKFAGSKTTKTTPEIIVKTRSITKTQDQSDSEDDSAQQSGLLPFSDTVVSQFSFKPVRGELNDWLRAQGHVPHSFFVRFARLSFGALEHTM